MSLVIADTSAIIAAYVLPVVGVRDLEAARAVIAHYRDLRLDLTDALSVVLAARFAVTEILTLDERDFRTVRPLTPGAPSFTLPIQDL